MASEDPTAREPYSIAFLTGDNRLILQFVSQGEEQVPWLYRIGGGTAYKFTELITVNGFCIQKVGSVYPVFQRAFRFLVRE